MRDAFLKTPPLQPKREICDYLESEGIRVPARIATLNDAIREGNRFIMLGEHPQDYDGASDLLRSRVVVPERHFRPEEKVYSTEEEVIAKVKSDHSYAGTMALLNHLPILSQETAQELLIHETSHTLKQYCSLLGISFEQFARQASFSYWQYIEGINHTVVADTAIEHRYHIFSSLMKQGDRIASYIIWENGLPTELAYPGKHAAMLTKRAPRLIELYESVRTLPKFDPKHCPIIEIQTDKDESDYCLQVHRTSDFEPRQIDLSDVKDEETYFSRGATPEKGTVYDISVQCGENGAVLPEQFLPNAGAYLPTMSTAFIELNVKMRGAHLVHAKVRDDDYEFMKLAENHSNRSELFKPPVSVQVPITDIMNRNEWRKMQDDPSLSIPVEITSDGRRATVKRV